jgi:hypothetical protein
MALPIQPKDTQAGCNPVSSNCVIWQGPDIPCITLCRGDSISDVTYKMATELCTLVDQLAITGFDVSCFPPICPKPENIHDLIQFILDQLCSCCITNSSTGTTSTAGTCPDDCIVSVCEDFQYPDPLGNWITTMSLPDYVTAIGNKVCELYGTNTTVKSNVSSIENRLTTLEDCVLPCGSASTPVIQIPTSCLTAGSNIPIETFVQTLETAFCDLQAATGTPTEILGAISQECINLDTTPTLNNSAVSYNALPGWISAGSYNTMADAINNMWLTICDIRTAVQAVVTNCCNPSCDSVDITMSFSYANPNLSITFNGTAPGFADCAAGGMFVTVTDSYGVSYTTQLSVIANLAGSAQVINLATSGVNLFSNYTIQLHVCATDGTLTCDKCVIDTFSNPALCPAMTYADDVNYIDYTFTNSIASPVTYIVECWNNPLSTLVVSNTIVNPAVGAVVGSITGLTAATTYQLRVRVIVGSTISDCPYTTVTTKP